MKIEKLYINNFRSLVEFKVDEFDLTTIFYGANNAGKSNILAALEFVFQRKVQFDRDDFTQPTNFYEGVIRGFSNNFYNNEEDSIINFIIDIKIPINETKIKDSIKSLFKKWPNELIFSFEGEIINNPTLGNDYADLKTKKIKLNNIIIYESDLSNVKYFPTISTKSTPNTSELSNAFSHLIDPFNDCVYIIGSMRNMQPTSFEAELLDGFKPDIFKKSLYSLYLDEKKHSVFEEINSVFNEAPFSFGTISFAKINDELELMIKNNGIRLPIKHLGSGVEQILFIIASLIYTRRKIICIEELEQNLSPKLQNLALRKLQSMVGKFFDQIILSSHSSVFSKPKLSNAIYLIKKQNLKTVVSERLNNKFEKEIKQHFIDSALPRDTYTDEELRKRTEEIDKLTEEGFKR